MTRQMIMLIEASGIQDYIFGSNQLGQNIGASHLVREATSTWIASILPDPHNFTATRITDESIQRDGLAAEVIYAGGGKAAILFADEGSAAEFAKSYSMRVLKEARGLQLITKRAPFDPVAPQASFERLWLEMQKRKQARCFSVPLPGLAVTAKCAFTGAPAVDFREGHLVSAEVKAKLDAEESGKNHLKELLPQLEASGYELTYDFNDFGLKGESSHIAVVHIDGNNMGRRIRELTDHDNSLKTGGSYISSLRRFSSSIRKAAKGALERTIDTLLDPANLKDGQIGGLVPIKKREGRKLLPFRPIVFGGDDATFVCEGRLGIAVAARYLEELSLESLSDGKPAFDRAGVAVVKSHYPFSRAYELAEDLCGSAKTLLNDWEKKGESRMSALDWHIATTGLVLPLKEVRKREYTCPSGSLLMRPVALNHPRDDWRSLETFAKLVEGFRDEEGEWAGRRNKIKALRDALRGGHEAVKLFLRGVRTDLPEIRQLRDMKTQGWQANECGYFDVIEALDFYVPLLKGGKSI